VVDPLGGSRPLDLPLVLEPPLGHCVELEDVVVGAAALDVRDIRPVSSVQHQLVHVAAEHNGRPGPRVVWD